MKQLLFCIIPLRELSGQQWSNEIAYANNAHAVCRAWQSPLYFRRKGHEDSWASIAMIARQVITRETQLVLFLTFSLSTFGYAAQ
jgi:hypothetical protein